ncbi:hypothetical protein HYH03_009475 [Edaphochlamys debaryana]|uniref:tRNA-5-taurinomethyluridine 2-sulfurtransferase n=1 Tax=Edaphochlamys debaryana TaxID=47281 RepID=A0A835Y1A2_9CHLO|nr:hypothetical protein HYH03_009475 [Edaphochlamys debaryana]|eukprot:KAG2492231.1 hypothetical protein HYH03_009475 [Edaphochlamys debaryana]
MTPSLRGCLSSCGGTVRTRCSDVARLLSPVLGGFARQPSAGGPATVPCPIAPTPSRQATTARVAGLRDLPTSSTPLPPLGGGAPAAQARQEADDGFVAPLPEEWAQHELLMAGCEPGKQLNVAVLLSGGVDSSLALRLLVAAGHRCRAFYLQIWFQEDFRNFWDACPWEEDLEYARKVCDSLGVPLEVVPLTTEYWDRVVSSSVAEIREGRTPNPDIWCNSRVKFGAFYDYLDRTHGAAFDRVASGHYARVERGHAAAAAGGAAAEAAGEAAASRAQQEAAAGAEERRRSGGAASGSSRGQGPEHGNGSRNGNGGAAVGRQEEEEVRLLLTPDAVKDQTYFLANLSPRQLARVMFPLGCLTKSQVRKLAAAADLANKNRKDSQGICFLGKVKFHEFVREHLGEWPGPILEAETGQPLGVHAGYWFYTVGQRGGIKLPGGPWYVVAKDTLHNAVLVSRQYYDGGKARNAFACGPFNWLSPDVRPQDESVAGTLYVKVRHGPNMYRCWLELHEKPSTYGTDIFTDGAGDAYGTVVLEANDQGLAAGQYAVLYQGGRCLGSAVITGTVEAPPALAAAAAAAVAAAAATAGVPPAALKAAL